MKVSFLGKAVCGGLRINSELPTLGSPTELKQVA